MIMYTSMPLELVYEGFDDFRPQYEEIEYNGVHMVIEPTGKNQARIVRLLSPDPQDYLNPDYFPGTLIHFYPPGRDN